VSRDRHIDTPAAAVCIGLQFDCLAALRSFQENLSQPSSIGSIDTERLAENPRFVSTARMPGVQTVVLDLSNIEYRPFAIW
jgi:hypothetical protein